MAGTGYHPEGHKFQQIDKEVDRYGAYTYICKNCAQVTNDLDADNGDCIDDY